MATQITITQQCTNTAQAATHISSLLSASGIGSKKSGFVVLKSQQGGTATLRNNTFAQCSFTWCAVQTGTKSVIRFRNGGYSLADVAAAYDSDVRVGDVYDVYVLKNGIE